VTSGDDQPTVATHEWLPAETDLAERRVRHFLNLVAATYRDPRQAVGRPSISADDDGRRRLMRLPVTAAGTD
jgi:hypothetical protein